MRKPSAAFTFHYGQIKRFDPSQLATQQDYLHSTMVRLKGPFLNPPRPFQVNLHSTMVRLKARAQRYTPRDLTDLHSTMVRLKGESLRVDRRRGLHLHSTMVRLKGCIPWRFSVLDDIYIPLWSD